MYVVYKYATMLYERMYAFLCMHGLYACFTCTFRVCMYVCIYTYLQVIHNTCVYMHVFCMKCLQEICAALKLEQEQGKHSSKARARASAGTLGLKQEVLSMHNKLVCA